MEKKTYIKPEIEVEEMAIESPMLTGSLTFNDEYFDTDPVNPEDGGQLSNRYRRTKRGQWGDLWYTGE